MAWRANLGLLQTAWREPLKGVQVISRGTICSINSPPACDPKRAMPFIGCYLLQSKNEQAKGKTYIGFTVNPKRRIRQHNGEITNGAFKTKKWRPWDMVLVVYGFATQTSALQFEWAWQHPEKSLDVRDAAARVGRKARYGVSGKVLLLMEILNSSPWKYHPLSVMFLSGEHARLQAGARAPPPHVTVRVGPLDDLSCGSDDDDAVEADQEDQDQDLGKEYRDENDDRAMSSQHMSSQLMVGGGESSLSLCGGVLKSVSERGGGGGDTRGGRLFSVDLTLEDDDDYIGGGGDNNASQMSISMGAAAAVPQEQHSTAIEQAEATTDMQESEKGAKPAKKKRSTATLCILCSRAATRTWAVCSGCGARTHVECLAEHFLGNSPSSSEAPLDEGAGLGAGSGSTNGGGAITTSITQRVTLPTGGCCPSCGQRTSWNDVLKVIGNVGWGGRKRPQQADAAGQAAAPAAAAATKAASPKTAKGRGRKAKNAVAVKEVAAEELVVVVGGGGALETEEQQQQQAYTEYNYEMDAAQQPWDDYYCSSPDNSLAAAAGGAGGGGGGGGYGMSSRAVSPFPSQCGSSDNEMAISPGPVPGSAGVPLPVIVDDSSSGVVDLVSPGPAPLAQRLAQRGAVVVLPPTPEVIDLLDD